jgi:hypothetical protein
MTARPASKQKSNCNFKLHNCYELLRYIFSDLSFLLLVLDFVLVSIGKLCLSFENCIMQNRITERIRVRRNKSSIVVMNDGYIKIKVNFASAELQIPLHFYSEFYF